MGRIEKGLSKSCKFREYFLMIFVTVGTHEQPFDRLVKYMDKWAEIHKEVVIIQTGFSTYKPKNCVWKKMLPYNDMKKYISEARLVITHGGPSSFIMPLQINKIPIVVPRKKDFSEHINNHQLEFARVVASRQGNIIVVENVNDLENIIEKYDNIIKKMNDGMHSNNQRFCADFEKIIDKMVNG